ncbi:MAG: hypothetical protein HQ477_02625 [Chloroflexi bacterium]|nr:hypothetical protein [Chloroflexota bacterium]
MSVVAIAVQSLAIAWLLGGWLLDVAGIMPTVLTAVIGGLTVFFIAIVASKELRSS